MALARHLNARGVHAEAERCIPDLVAFLRKQRQLVGQHVAGQGVVEVEADALIDFRFHSRFGDAQ
eukprot:8672834-Prorocentrum_lima.AAC.1